MKELTRSKGAYYRTKLGRSLIKADNVIELTKPKAKKKSKSKKK